MAKKRKGRDISGWLIIDKPAGITSTAVVNKVKWALNSQKAGHAGTLDPDATGVLAVALGEATKTIPYVTNALKAYEFKVRLGQSTSTDDAEGEIINQSALRPRESVIKEALLKFVGNIQQVPPKFSAVKIDGERAHKLARQGEDLTLSARPLYVESLILLDTPDTDHIELEMICGKGGYVRSIARDLGEFLGCYGHVQNLRRIWSGPFGVEQAVTFATVERLAKTPDLDQFILPLEVGLNDLKCLSCRPENVAKLRHGNPAIVISSDAEYGETCWAALEGRAVAIGIYRAGELHPNRVFAEPSLNDIHDQTD
jgi:tRNA pseudouridine55 synthase